MIKTTLRWLAVACVGGAMACASAQKVGEQKPAAKAEAEAATAVAVPAGKFVTNPKDEAFPFVIAKAPVKIDGDLSDWPADLPVGKVSNADGSRAAVFRIFAHGDRIYTAFQVKDGTPTINKEVEGGAWNGDTIELTLGTHDEPHGGWAKGDVQVFVTYNPAAPHVYNNTTTKVMKATQVVEKTTADGWLVEASFTVADLGIGAPAPGAPVWIDVALDNSNGGGRGSQFVWIGNGDFWKTPSMWKKTSFVAQP
jgi:hypothetical protein